MPTNENDNVPADLPPDEKTIRDEILPKVTKLGYQVMVTTATTFLETQRLAREQASQRIKAEKAEAERVRLVEEERKRREEEIKRMEEEARIKAEEEERQKAEEERKRVEEEKRREEERLRIEEEKRRKAEEELKAAQAAAEAAKLKREQEMKAEEEARQKAIQEAEQQAREEEEKRKKEAEELKAQMEAAAKKAEEEAKAAAEAARIAKEAHDKKELDATTLEQDEQKEKALEEAMKARDAAKIAEILKDYKSQTSAARRAAKLLKLLEDEQRIVTQLSADIKEMNVERMKEYLIQAHDIDLDHKVVHQAREIVYGMKTEDQITARLHVALEKKDIALISSILEDAKSKNIENSEIRHAEDFVKVKSAQAASDVKIAEAVSAAAAASAAAPAIADAPEEKKAVTPQWEIERKEYISFIQYAGLFSLRTFKACRKEGEYAKGKPKEIRAAQFVWQKDKLPSTLIKIDAAYCGGDANTAALAKKVARLLFQNIHGYMGDRYHPYPLTLCQHILVSGEKEPLLRDEIYAQLIKQTTNHPIPESEVFGWKLIYLCLLTFPPGKHMHSLLLSHAAARGTLDFEKKSFAWKTIPDMVFHIWQLLRQSKPSYKAPNDAQLIQDVTAGTLPVVDSPFAS
jgi:hypothetical protein